MHQIIFHSQELEKRWQTLPFLEQMANIGSEFERAIKWKNKKNHKLMTNAFYRALELIDFTRQAHVTDDGKMTELSRARELAVDFFAGKNIYRSTDDQWHKYFYPFHFALKRNG